MSSLPVERAERVDEAEGAEDAAPAHAPEHDSPTGLLGRQAFDERLRESLARARRQRASLAVLRLRIEAGPGAASLPVGAVWEAADRLRVCLRDGDPLAQLSRCEFGVLIHDAARDRDVGVVARRLLQELTRESRVAGGAPAVHVGIALYPGSGSDADELLRNAEAAMYQVKSSGGGFHFYEEGVNRAVANRLRQESSLQQAIERDELMVHYQPQIDLARDSFSAVEALLRWRSEEGLAEPASFFPAAESLGLLRRMGEWVLRNACRELAELEASTGTSPILGVNVARSQLDDPAFPELVLDVLAEADRSAHALELEIHEDLLDEEHAPVREPLAALRRRGVRVAVDGFGSGRAGLQGLRRIEVDVIKIDRGFVRAVATERAAASVVAAVVTLARGLECQVAAVGVESEEQARALAGLGCTRMQGFAVSPPVAARDLARALGERLAGAAEPSEEIQF